jgi:hypothetical protein
LERNPGFSATLLTYLMIKLGQTRHVSQQGHQKQAHKQNGEEDFNKRVAGTA